MTLRKLTWEKASGNVRFVDRLDARNAGSFHGNIYAGTYADLWTRFGFAPDHYRHTDAVTIQWTFVILTGRFAGKLFSLSDWEEEHSPLECPDRLYQFRVCAETPEIARAACAELFVEAFELSLDEEPLTPGEVLRCMAEKIEGED